MITKILAFLVLIIVTYTTLIFVTPEFIDTYGFSGFNERVRMLKRASELDRNLDASGSLVNKATDIAKPYIDESKKLIDESMKTVENVNSVVTEKTEQAKQVIETAQETYEKVEETRTKINTFTQFGTGN